MFMLTSGLTFVKLRLMANHINNLFGQGEGFQSSLGASFDLPSPLPYRTLMGSSLMGFGADKRSATTGIACPSRRALPLNLRCDKPLRVGPFLLPPSASLINKEGAIISNLYETGRCRRPANTSEMKSLEIRAARTTIVLVQA
jgi:hypothetical protein